MIVVLSYNYQFLEHVKSSFLHMKTRRSLVLQVFICRKKKARRPENLPKLKKEKMNKNLKFEKIQANLF